MRYNCLSLRCSWSIACRRCSNYILILDLTPSFNRLHSDNCKTRQETFKCRDLVRLILETWRYVARLHITFNSNNPSFSYTKWTTWSIKPNFWRVNLHYEVLHIPRQLCFSRASWEEDTACQVRKLGRSRIRMASHRENIASLVAAGHWPHGLAIHNNEATWAPWHLKLAVTPLIVRDSNGENMKAR